MLKMVTHESVSLSTHSDTGMSAGETTGSYAVVRAIQHLGVAEGLRVLAKANIGRLSIAGAYGPGFLVNYAIDGDVVLFSTAGKAARSLRAGDVMTLHAEMVDVRYQQGWSLAMDCVVEPAQEVRERNWTSSWWRLRPIAVSSYCES